MYRALILPAILILTAYMTHAAAFDDQRPPKEKSVVITKEKRSEPSRNGDRNEQNRQDKKEKKGKS